MSGGRGRGPGTVRSGGRSPQQAEVVGGPAQGSAHGSGSGSGGASPAALISASRVGVDRSLSPLDAPQQVACCLSGAPIKMAAIDTMIRTAFVGRLRSNSQQKLESSWEPARRVLSWLWWTSSERRCGPIKRLTRVADLEVDTGTAPAGRRVRAPIFTWWLGHDVTSAVRHHGGLLRVVGDP